MLDILLIILVFIVGNIVVRFLARRAGFRHAHLNLQRLGPAVFLFKWGSVRIGMCRYGRNVRITGYKDFIHLRLMRLFGGGEMLLPMKNADFKFSHWRYGEVVDVIIDGKAYGFGRDVAKMVKKYYC